MVFIPLKQENEENLYKLIRNAESGKTQNREESIGALNKAWNLYEQILKTRGREYVKNNYPDVPKRLNNLVDSLMEYNS